MIESNVSDRDILAGNLMSTWERLRMQGAAPSPEELCADCPDLLPMLRRHIAAARRFARLQDNDTQGIGPADSTVIEPGGPTPLVPGFEIRGELGRGGMGVVYAAVQSRLLRPVALKMILAGACAHGEDRRRFFAEAEIVASLQHPHIVQVYDVGEHDQQPYLVMEYVEGQSLAESLRQQPHSPRAAAELVRTLAQTVHYAHEHGVIHRDLKPANVLVRATSQAVEAGEPTSRQGGLTEKFPKIVDFGLAKCVGRETRLTRSDALLGTPSYMAPEQTGKVDWGVSPATDVYGLGAILYELLTGHPPFLAATTIDTLQQVLGDDPVPPRRWRPRLAQDLETICLKCLAKRPEHRYSSAASLADDLDRFLNQRPIVARPISTLEWGLKWIRRHRVPATVASIVGLAAVALLGSIVVSGIKLRRAASELRQERQVVAQARAEADRHKLAAEHEANQVRAEMAEATNAMHQVLEALNWSAVDPNRTVSASSTRQAQLEAALAYFERNSAQHPENAGPREEVARVLWKLGSLATQLGRREEAERWLRRCCETYESLRPSLPEWEVEMGKLSCWDLLADNAVMRRQFADAEVYARARCATLERLVYDGLPDPPRRSADSSQTEKAKVGQSRASLERQLLHARSRLLAILSRQPERQDDIDTLYRESLAEARRMLVESPETTLLGELYVLLVVTRSTHALREDPRSARRVVDEFLPELNAAIAVESFEPRRQEYRLGLARCLYNRAMAERQLGDLRAAADSLRHAIALRRELPDQPGRSDGAVLLAQYTRALSSCLTELGEQAEAELVLGQLALKR